jgi:hypothetical protein
MRYVVPHTRHELHLLCVDGSRKLQFALIWRVNDHQWAFPGGAPILKNSKYVIPLFIHAYHCPGMVEAGKHITATRTQEFGEEAMAMLDASDEAGKKVRGDVFYFLHVFMLRRGF